MPGVVVWPLGGDEMRRVEPPRMRSECPQPFGHLRTRGEGTVCELWRGLTRHGACCVLILDVPPAGSEDSARVLLRRAQQTAPPLLFRLASFLLWSHLLLRVASRAGGEPALAPIGKSVAGMNPSCLTLLLS
ncbi:unnamed protein product [Rangifer tarandus platyrhynchus]|uniref:Uncharacterized protein n=1 Tax=Rangifer tarandus platyrhynchus TaxID=3082113 RepID=A0ABN8ZCE2_RANTA|nr:unnamed protein product [Rangifer tarandus platyrhynchus]